MKLIGDHIVHKLISQLRQLMVGVILLLAFSTASAVPSLEITSVNIDFVTNQISIHGVNFDNGTDLEINLSSFGQIDSLNVGPTLIVASFPLGGLPAGNYLLTITTGGGAVRHDQMAITVGAVGPEGLQGEQGPQGLQGIPGVDGTDGAAGAQGEHSRGDETGAQQQDQYHPADGTRIR